jgi:hypothetical protein
MKRYIFIFSLLAFFACKKEPVEQPKQQPTTSKVVKNYTLWIEQDAGGIDLYINGTKQWGADEKYKTHNLVSGDSIRVVTTYGYNPNRVDVDAYINGIKHQIAHCNACTITWTKILD